MAFGCISKTVIMVLLDEVLKCEAQSVSAEDPPTHMRLRRTGPRLHYTCLSLIYSHITEMEMLTWPSFYFSNNTVYYKGRIVWGIVSNNMRGGEACFKEDICPLSRSYDMWREGKSEWHDTCMKKKLRKRLNESRENAVDFATNSADFMF